MVSDLVIPMFIGLTTGLISSAIGHGLDDPRRWLLLAVGIGTYLVIKHRRTWYE